MKGRFDVVLWPPFLAVTTGVVTARYFSLAWDTPARTVGLCTVAGIFILGFYIGVFKKPWGYALGLGVLALAARLLTQVMEPVWPEGFDPFGEAATKEEVAMALEVRDKGVPYTALRSGKPYYRTPCRLLLYQQTPGQEQEVEVWFAADSLYREFPPGTCLFVRGVCYGGGYGLPRVFPSLWYEPQWPSAPSLSLRLRRARIALERRWDALAQGPEVDFMKGLCLGNKKALSYQSKQEFYRAGVGHIVAVSGMHLNVVCGLCFLLLRGAGRLAKWLRKLLGRVWCQKGKEALDPSSLLRPRYPKAPLFVLPLAWAYALFTGFGAGVQRAALMMTLKNTGEAFGRRATGLNLLCAAALVLLVVRPANFWDVGCQLSFAAVASLLLLQRPLQFLYAPKTAVGRYFWELFTVSLAVQLGTCWLSLIHFKKVVWAGLLANLFLVPLSSVILYLFVFYLPLLGICEPLAEVLFKAMHFVAQLFFLLLSNYGRLFWNSI